MSSCVVLCFLKEKFDSFLFLIFLSWISFPSLINRKIRTKSYSHSHMPYSIIHFPPSTVKKNSVLFERKYFLHSWPPEAIGRLSRIFLVSSDFNTLPWRSYRSTKFSYLKNIEASNKKQKQGNSFPPPPKKKKKTHLFFTCGFPFPRNRKSFV